jgi:adenylate cyclase class 2
MGAQAMKPEYEARFTDIDTDAITARLIEHNAVQRVARTLMRRIVFTNADIDAKGGWLRLRQQADRVYLTYKQTAHDQNTIDRILEAQVQVGSFDAAKHLLEAMGFTARRYQENYREEWELDGVIYDIDTWPDLPTFLEIEGASEHEVGHAATRLGLDLSDASFGSVDELYLSQLGRDILAEPTLTFHQPT